MAVERLSLAMARRVALAAQGLAERRPTTAVGPAELGRLLSRLGVVQLDSVNVLARSHQLPFYSRLGGYAVAGLVSLAASRQLFEYWGHEASLLPIDCQPLLRWRMARAGDEAWGRMVQIARDQPGFVAAVLAEVRERGPLAASQLSAAGVRPYTGMWGWTEGKTALEWLFWSGQLTSAGRRASFERIYDLPERVLPPAVLAAPTPDAPTAQRQLLGRAGRALGVATASDLADYYRLKLREVRPRLDELVESGELLPAAVEGWEEPCYLDPAALLPTELCACTLLSPFDSLVWERPRTERLFGMRLRLELYTPAEKRIHGYYVLPLLLGEALVGRVDLKADRAASTLRVLGAFAEPDHCTATVAAALQGELGCLARWLGLAEVTVAGRGDLVPLLSPRARAESASLAP